MKQDDHKQSNTPTPPHDFLTKREIEILKLIVQGNTSQQIAKMLFISIHTVNFHRKNIRSKLEVTSIGEMIHYAYTHQLI